MHPIEKIIQGNQRKKSKDIVADIIYVLSRDNHLSYREIKRMPLADVLKLLERWHKEQEEIKKQNKRIKR